MPDDCYFPENDEKDDSDMEFDLNHTPSPLMNTNIFSASVNQGGLYNEDSSDEAPDDITFETSKTSALQEIKDAFESVRQQKQIQKEKRQKKQELLAAQKLKKKQRLDELASKKLPDDILHAIANIHKSENDDALEETTQDQASSSANHGQASTSANHDQASSSANHDLAEQAPHPSTISKKKRKWRNKRAQLFKPAGELPPKETLDFIHMNSKTTEFHVSVLEKKVDNVVAKAVLLRDLKNKLIFGNVKKREPAWRTAAKLAKRDAARANNIHKMK